MLTRRHFLKIGGAVSAGLFLPGQFGQVYQAQPSQVNPLDPAILTKYLDALPATIPVQQPVSRIRGNKYYEVRMTQFTQKLHSQLPPTPLWGYSGQFPGKTFEVRRNELIYVKWINDIAGSKFLIPEAYDPFLHGTNKKEPAVKTVVHVHGAHVPPQWDGHPEAWFSRNFARTGPTFVDQVYQYPNKQEACSLWYHDHALGQTRLNVYAGLAGLYLIRDEEEDDLNLPKGAYEIPLLIQDRFFDSDGSLLYPARDPGEVPSQPGPWIPEFYGNTILVNGKIWPYLEVEPRKYRFRIYNGSNARYYNLYLGGLPFYQIAAEQGLFTAPVRREQILLAPGERADVIVDFSDSKGATFLLTNDANSPYPGGDPVDDHTSKVMQIKVTKPLAGRDDSTLPSRLREVERFDPEDARITRQMCFREYADEITDNPYIVLLNGKLWEAPITDKPKLGSVEVWNLINTTEDAHPIHLHLVRFQILDRQPFNVGDVGNPTRPGFGYLGDWNPSPKPGAGPDPIPVNRKHFTGPRLTPEAHELGWKDTVRANPGEVTRIIARFDDYVGKYAWHCHILEHEDNEMMLQFQVVQ